MTKKKFLIGILAILLVLSGCPDSDPDVDKDDNNKNNNNETVVLKITLNENNGWNDPGNESWGRWFYEYQDAKNLFDLSGMLNNNKVYILKYSFSSDINIDMLGFYFVNTGSNWKQITDWSPILGSISKNTKYSGSLVLAPNNNASGCQPADIYLRIDSLNRNVSTAATLTFSEFKLEQVNKESSGLDKWTVSGMEFTIDTGRTFAENLPTYNSKSNVLHIKPPYNTSNYDHFILQYDLSGYKGKTIEIEMSMDVYLKKAARIAWQVSTSVYPLICGETDSTVFHSKDTWLPLTGKNTVAIPNDSGYYALYLSGQQIEGAEAYIANAEVTITEK